jgi:hypothetical protein
MNKETLMFRAISFTIALNTAIIIQPSISAADDQTSVDRLILNYQQQCISAQGDISSDIDRDLDAPQTVDLNIDDDAIYEIKVTPEGKVATVVFTSFSCTNVGYAWCGVSGSCVSYLIIDEQVFEWAGGGRPVSVDTGEETLIVSSIGGSSCADSEGNGGFGSSPCYRVMVWDENLRSFFSDRGDVKARPDLSVLQVDAKD